jgi:hypothetical protein
MPTPSGWNDMEAGLYRKLFGADPVWGGLSFSGVNKLNKRFGKGTVTEAFQHAWEETTAGTLAVGDPYALMESICRNLKEQVSLNG